MFIANLCYLLFVFQGIIHFLTQSTELRAWNSVSVPFSKTEFETEFQTEFETEFEITNEVPGLYHQVSRYLIETYGPNLPRRRVIDQREPIAETEEVSYTYVISPGTYRIRVKEDTSPNPDYDFELDRGPDDGTYLEITALEGPDAPIAPMRGGISIYRQLKLRGSHDYLQSLLKSSYEYYNHVPIREDKIKVYTSTSWGGWSRPKNIPKRPLDTVYLPGNMKEKLLNDIKLFYSEARKKLYEHFSIPYRRNYLLAGPPGTGKTSLIRALASEMNKNIAILEFARNFGVPEKLS